MYSLDDSFIRQINQNPGSRNTAYIFVIVTMSSLLGILFAYVLTSMLSTEMFDKSTAQWDTKMPSTRLNAKGEKKFLRDNVIRTSTLLSRWDKKDCIILQRYEINVISKRAYFLAKFWSYVIIYRPPSTFHKTPFPSRRISITRHRYIDRFLSVWSTPVYRLSSRYHCQSCPMKMTAHCDDIDEKMSNGEYRFVCPVERDRTGNVMLNAPFDRLFLIHNYCTSAIPWTSERIRPNFTGGTVVWSVYSSKILHVFDYLIFLQPRARDTSDITMCLPYRIPLRLHTIESLYTRWLETTICVHAFYHQSRKNRSYIICWSMLNLPHLSRTESLRSSYWSLYPYRIS